MILLKNGLTNNHNTINSEGSILMKRCYLIILVLTLASLLMIQDVHAQIAGSWVIEQTDTYCEETFENSGQMTIGNNGVFQTPWSAGKLLTIGPLLIGGIVSTSGDYKGTLIGLQLGDLIFAIGNLRAQCGSGFTYFIGSKIPGF